MYNEKILELFKTLKNSGRVKKPSGVGLAKDELYGDMIEIFLKIDESGQILDSSFKAYGSVLAIATGSVVASLAKGKRLQEVLEITTYDIKNELGDFDSQRDYVLDIGIEALLNSVKDYYLKEEKKAKSDE